MIEISTLLDILHQCLVIAAIALTLAITTTVTYMLFTTCQTIVRQQTKENKDE